jgi:HEAT repeat protein
MISSPRLLLLFVAAFLCAAQPAHAYIDRAVTLGGVVRESERILLVQVERFSRDKNVVILTRVRDLKGQSDAAPIKHQLAPQGATVSRDVLEWAQPGQRAVLFLSAKTALVCLGRTWYQVQAGADGWWQPGANRPDLPLAYCGTVSRLSDAVELIAAGKTAVITTVPHGADDGASFDLALNRPNLPGLVRLQRIRANLQMPAVVMAVSANPAWVVGQGAAGEEEIPALIEKLKSPDALVRGESASDLRTLGPKAFAAAAPLATLLEDQTAAVRMSVAAALLRIAPPSPRGVAVLSEGLENSDPLVRAQAARAAGLAGESAAPLASKLASLLTDADELTRLAALQAVATIGPSAAGATDAVIKLLDDPQAAADAADALGRFGPAARPALKRLTQMLTADSIALRWAAVRAMSQIGSDDALPAVSFIVKQLPGASEVDGYNMMIYLALLGPVARDAIPAIQSARVQQPALKQAALWAIEPEKRFPWGAGGANGGPGGGPGGPGGGPGGRPGMGLDADIVRFVYECLVNELGDRFKPAAAVMARQIMDGTAGDLPLWSYKLLAHAPEQSIAILTPGLADAGLVQRERAAVALGYMGIAAAPAKADVARALAKAPTEREQRLIRWCLRQIDVKREDVKHEEVRGYGGGGDKLGPFDSLRSLRAGG